VPSPLRAWVVLWCYGAQEVASDIVGKSRGIEDIDVVAAVDCQKTEKTCMAMIKTYKLQPTMHAPRSLGSALQKKFSRRYFCRGYFCRRYSALGPVRCR
jgi:hypothetical protein